MLFSSKQPPLTRSRMVEHPRRFAIGTTGMKTGIHYCLCEERSDEAIQVVGGVRLLRCARKDMALPLLLKQESRAYKAPITLERILQVTHHVSPCHSELQAKNLWLFIRGILRSQNAPSE